MLTQFAQCDEQRPVCANCKRRYINVTCCEYNPKPSKLSKKLSVSSKSSSSSPPVSVIFERQVSFKPFRSFEASDSNRVLELRLLHHYTKTTCAGQSLRAMVPFLGHPMWEIDIPQMAFLSPIVLDALLGISALHLLAFQPNDHSLAVASRSYFNKAVTQQRDALSSVNAENAETLLVAAVLIAHHTWLATHITDQTDERYKINLQTYQMCLGINALIRRATPWLEKYSWSPKSSQSRPGKIAGESGFMKLALQDLASLSTYFNRNGVPSEDSAAYEKATGELVAIYHLVMNERLDTSRVEQEIVAILHRLPTRFLELLEREDPIAMALLARDLSLLSFLEDSKAWWIHGAGEQKVPNKAVLGIRGLMPTEWLWTMEWPLNIIAREIKLDID